MLKGSYTTCENVLPKGIYRLIKGVYGNPKAQLNYFLIYTINKSIKKIKQSPRNDKLDQVQAEQGENIATHGTNKIANKMVDFYSVIQKLY